MKIPSIICSMLVFAAPFNPVFGQERPEGAAEKLQRQRQLDFFIDISDEGIGAGLKIYYDTLDKDTKLGFGFLFTGVRGEEEAIVFDPFTGIPHRVGRKFFTVLAPFNFSIKRRLFRERVASNLRPFIVAEAGPVWGIAFPTANGFSNGIKKGKGQLSAGAFMGFGIEFGDKKTREYGLTLGVHYIKFPHALGERSEYLGIDVRFSFLNEF